MNVTCPNCATVYRVDPDKVPEAGVRARCAVCSAVFAVHREAVASRPPAPTPVTSGVSAPAHTPKSPQPAPAPASSPPARETAAPAGHEHIPEPPRRIEPVAEPVRAQAPKVEPARAEPPPRGDAGHRRPGAGPPASERASTRAGRGTARDHAPAPTRSPPPSSRGPASERRTRCDRPRPRSPRPAPGSRPRDPIRWQSFASAFTPR